MLALLLSQWLADLFLTRAIGTTAGGIVRAVCALLERSNSVTKPGAVRCTLVRDVVEHKRHSSHGECWAAKLCSDELEAILF